MDQGECNLQACRTISTCDGMAYSVGELMVVLANLTPVAASWRALCLNRGGFEGGGVVVDWGVSRRARESR
jgi:hypothetical protein